MGDVITYNSRTDRPGLGVCGYDGLPGDVLLSNITFLIFVVLML